MLSCRIPETWAVEDSDIDLRPSLPWSSTADSWPLIGAGKFRKNQLKIVQDNKDLSPCLDSNGAVNDAVRKRFCPSTSTEGSHPQSLGTVFTAWVDDCEEIIEEVQEV